MSNVATLRRRHVERAPVPLAAAGGLDALLPRRVVVVGELDLHADRPGEPRAGEVAQDRHEIDLPLTEHWEVEHPLAATLILQVDVPVPAEAPLDVALRSGADVVHDVAGVVVDLDPVMADLVEQLHPYLGGGQEVRVRLDAQ